MENQQENDNQKHEEKRVSPEGQTVDRKSTRTPRGPNKTRIRLAKELCERLGVDPLEAMLKIIKNRRLPIAVRLDAAKGAAVYVYPRLSAIAVNLRQDENSSQMQAALLKLMENPRSLQLAQDLSLQLTSKLCDQNEPKGLPAPQHRDDIRDANIIDAEFWEPEPRRNA